MAGTEQRPPRQQGRSRAEARRRAIERGIDPPIADRDEIARATAPAPAQSLPPARFARLPELLFRPETLVLLAMVVAAILRFYRLGDIPPGLNQDEAVNGYDAYSLFQTGRDHLGHAFPIAGLESLGDWASPLLTFLTIPAVGLFGLTLETIRCVAALVGVLAVPAIYWLAVELFGVRLPGVAAAWLIALSPWHAHLSRWAIPPATVATMVALTLLALVWSVNRLSSRGIVVTGIVAGLTILGYPTMKLYVPLLGLAALAVYWRALLRFKKEVLIYAALAVLLIAGPSLYVSTRDPGGRARFDQESIFKQADLHLNAAFLVKQYLAYFSTRYLFVSADSDPMHLPGQFGIELRALAPLLLTGLLGSIYAVLRRGTAGERWFPWLRRQPAALLLLALVCYPIPGALTKPSPLALRGAQYIPLAALFAAIGVAITAEMILRLFKLRRAAIAQAALAVLLLLPTVSELVNRFHYYFTDYADTVVWHYQYGLQQALDFARAQPGYDEIWVDRTNQPYILVLFFTRADPDTVHRNLQVRRQPPSFNSVDAFGKFHFGDPFGGKQATIPVLYTISRPAGQPRYEVRGGVYEGRKILLVRKP